jgi:hypothetical protein
MLAESGQMYPAVHRTVHQSPHAAAGCLTNLLRTTPAAALTFTSFELIARGLRQVSMARIKCAS